MRRLLRCVCFLYFLILSIGCSQESSQQVDQGAAAATEERARYSREDYVETGDLAEINQHGEVRLIAPRWDYVSELPRQGTPGAVYHQLAQEFVINLGLEPKWVYVRRFEDLIPTLLEGHGDLIVANLTVTQKRNEQVAFSLPLEQITELVLVANSNDTIRNIDDLKGLTIVIPAGSSYQDTLAKIDTIVELADSEITPDEIIDLVVDEAADATLMDSNQALSLLHYRDDFHIAFTASETKNIAWATRPDAINLVQALDLFITEHRLSRRQIGPYKVDLPGILEKKTLRVLTRNSPATYFLWKGELLGFEYELAKMLAKHLGVRLEIIVPKPGDDILDWLAAGRGDMIAAGMTITDERINRGFTFSRPYHQVNEVFVTNSDTLVLSSLADLAGRTVVAHPDYSYWDSLNKLKSSGVSFELKPVPFASDTSDIIAGIADGTYEITLADSHLVNLESTYHANLNSNLGLAEPVHHGWVVRNEDPELLKAVNQFLKKGYRGLNFNLIYNKYFVDSRRSRASSERTFASGTISPYDILVKQGAPVYQFDWRLLVSQMYQESRFDPKARSFAGAVGLFQLLPRTAKQLGFDRDDLVIPEKSVQAGIEYLDWTRDRFSETLPIEERLWFALAAYNAGFGHVRDARRLAKQKNWNPDSWFDNVERAILLLSKKEYYSNARFGYCRGSETAKYVRDIRNRYQAYVDLAQAQ